MDFSESTRIVFNRIQQIEPDLVYKIVDHLLSKEDVDREMIRLAFGPDRAIHSLINEVKAAVPVPGLSPNSPVSLPRQPIPDLPRTHFVACFPLPRPICSPAVQVPISYGDAQIMSNQKQAICSSDFVPTIYADLIEENYRVHDEAHFLNFDKQLDSLSHVGPNFSSNYYHQEAALTGGLSTRANSRSPSLSEFPVKACHYFFNGYCKHGNNCRYFHGHSDSSSQIHLFSQNSNEWGNEDHFLSSGSLEKLELELSELLKSRGGQPISIAMLPMLYYDRYGKVLQAEGYLTESQRHGKAGYNLTKLLARLNNRLRLLERPNGQHSVVLAEDASKHMLYKNVRSDPGAVVAGSQQIYLTFPAESTFTEEDVSNYFRQYGPVNDVRIPCQHKRMFGFVSFVHPETVNVILAKGNPHYVSGTRILVKPYREKSRSSDSKYTNRIGSPTYYPSFYLDTAPKLQLMPNALQNTRLLRKRNDEQEQALELQRCLFELQLAPKPFARQLSFGSSMNELNVPEGLAVPGK